METFLEQFQYLKIPLKEITSATNNFDDEKNSIGVGGFGKVYKGYVSHSKGRSMVAIKRLDRRHGQGTPEFLKEITTLSRYSHENLISLLGFCYQGDEMILVYEHASRGSLDHHLNSPHLTWSQRLQICLDVAKGLTYLHDPRETHQRLIHCDMKSANILLDDQWNAKVSDFGLSIMGPANEQQSVIVTVAAGTPGYCDPQYAMTHTLTKESDVYSFGVVLFEVLCGTLCCTYSKGRVQRILVPVWIETYKQKKLSDIIFKNPTIQPLDPNSLVTFSDIAYRCLKESREDRPKMAEVVAELEIALDSQELHENPEFSEWKAPLTYYEEIIKTAEPPLNYRSKVRLRKRLSKGVLLDGRNTLFSLNKKGDHCVMTSFAECLGSVPYYGSEYNSRFAAVICLIGNRRVETHVKTQLLSLGITYTVNLVFKFGWPKKTRKHHDLISLRYKLQGETATSISNFAYERDDGWWMVELYQFTSDQKYVDLQILFEGFIESSTVIVVEGIEFLPLEKVEEKDETQPISNLDAQREDKLPSDYKDIMKWSKSSVQWATKKEAYSIMCNGFLINDGQEWFSLDNNGKKCYMLSARAAGIHSQSELHVCLPESRFGEAFELHCRTFVLLSKIQPQLLSPETTYGTYLVYKLSEDRCGFEAPMEVKDEKYSGSGYVWHICLTSPRTPVIRPKDNQNTHNPPNKPKISGLPHKRNDGWVEVQIWEFRTTTTTKMIPMRVQLSTYDRKAFKGLIVQGVEFRPFI